MCLQQAYKRKKIKEIIQINRNSNLANAITKLKAYTALRNLINTNKVNVKATK